MTMFFLSFFALAAGADESSTTTTEPREIVEMNLDEIVETTNRCDEPCEKQKPEGGDEETYTAELMDGTRGIPGRGFCNCTPEGGDVYENIGKDFVRVCKGEEGLSFHHKQVDGCKNGWETVASTITAEQFGACINSRMDHCDGPCFLTQDDAETSEQCPVSRDNIIGNTHSCGCKKKPNCILAADTTDDITYECTEVVAELRRRSLRA